jgi:hypothetical protein
MAESVRRNAVVAGAPMVVNKCFATEAPAWNDSIATSRKTIAVDFDVGVGAAELTRPSYSAAVGRVS